MAKVSEEKLSLFRLVPENEFTYAHLEEYPVWSEFYDYDEREEIIEWGIDPEWLDQELARHQSGNIHPVYPLLEVNPFPARSHLYIRARFETPAGQSLVGYIINEDASPAISIFYGGRLFSFNRVMFEWGMASKEALQQLLPNSADPILPLKYETDFTDDEGNKIEGVFDYKFAVE